MPKREDPSIPPSRLPLHTDPPIPAVLLNGVPCSSAPSRPLQIYQTYSSEYTRSSLKMASVQTVRQIWADVLGIKTNQFGDNENFMDCMSPDHNRQAGAAS